MTSLNKLLQSVARTQGPLAYASHTHFLHRTDVLHRAGILALIALLAVPTMGCTTESPPAGRPSVTARAVRAQFVVKPRADVGGSGSEAFARRLGEAAGCRVEHVRAMAGGMQLFAAYAATPESAEACVRNANRAPGVEWAERDAEMTTQQP